MSRRLASVVPPSGKGGDRGDPSSLPLPDPCPPSGPRSSPCSPRAPDLAPGRLRAGARLAEFHLQPGPVAETVPIWLSEGSWAGTLPPSHPRHLSPQPLGAVRVTAVSQHPEWCMAHSRCSIRNKQYSYRSHFTDEQLRLQEVGWHVAKYNPQRLRQPRLGWVEDPARGPRGRI